ncbi:FeoA family protein [Phormidium sp. FACHB-1136]|uniref:FeoA family protein n=1 Tax=Phormidium sp. FACHB-1136 TaxID=2692848 RepID=UPI001687B726|nr:FeoA family protein [Phormidium sp. FACHB-1136]MBD2429099.1 ferrous iron transport protein A [Phormidium sp. FACHB-1136]
MKFDSAPATSPLPIDAQGLGFTFIGGSADVDSVSSPSRAATPSTRDALLPLPMMAIGDRAWIVEIKGGHRMVRRLTDLGLAQGSEITIVSRSESGSVIVGFQGCRIGIGAGIAHRVIVSTAQPSRLPVGPSAATPPSPAQPSEDCSMSETLHLGALAVGQSGRILGYESSHRAYREKLLSMGLTPGTHVTITRQAPLGDPIEVEVRGYKLSLRKGEAAALKVEIANR